MADSLHVEMVSLMYQEYALDVPEANIIQTHKIASVLQALKRTRQIIVSGRKTQSTVGTDIIMARVVSVTQGHT